MSIPARGAQAQYQDALDQGRLVVQRCNHCDRRVHFPRELCPHCGADALAFVEPSGAGTVHAVTTVRRRAEQGGDYNVCLVDLDEGVRLMSRVEGLRPEEVRIGLRLRARVALADGRGLVVFDAEAA